MNIKALKNELIDIKIGGTVLFENINVNNQKIVEVIINNDPNNKQLEVTNFTKGYSIF